MSNTQLAVLYSFPFPIGGRRISATAWHQVDGLTRAGADVFLYCGSVARPVSAASVNTTLARGRIRVPYRVLGKKRAIVLHDWMVSRQLESKRHQIDIIHAWPTGALITLRVAQRLGIPTVLERPNAHTRFAYNVVQAEATRIGVRLSKGSEHAYNGKVLKREEAEYRAAYRLLCPSEFVRKSFEDEGFLAEKLMKTSRGHDASQFYPSNGNTQDRPFTALFAGYAAVRKGLHFALDAWLKSSASTQGLFLIAGEIMPAYRDYLLPMLAHPTVRTLGQRDDLPELMRQSDVLVFPSIEEGFGRVVVEAMGTGCVPLVSTAASEPCIHGSNSLIHGVGDVKTLSDHISLLFCNREIRNDLRKGALKTAPNFTWEVAGERLIDVYRQVIDTYHGERRSRES